MPLDDFRDSADDPATPETVRSAFLARIGAVELLFPDVAAVVAGLVRAAQVEIVGEGVVPIDPVSLPRIVLGPPDANGLRDARIETAFDSYVMLSAVCDSSTSPDEIIADIIDHIENSSDDVPERFLIEAVRAMPIVDANAVQSPRPFVRILVGPPRLVEESRDEERPAASRKLVVEFPFGFAHSSAWHDFGADITPDDVRVEVSRHVRTANEPAVGKEYDQPHFAGSEFLAHYVETSPDVEIVLDSADPRVSADGPPVA